jgi:hypothetical protein
MSDRYFNLNNRHPGSAMKVWCDDDASHPAKRQRVFIAEFVKDGVLWLPQQRRAGHASVQRWRDDSGAIVGSPEAGQGALLHHTMECRYCKRPLTVRVGKLDAALDLAADAGRGDCTLSELRAILSTSQKLRQPLSR